MLKRILNYFRYKNIYQKMVNYKEDITIEEKASTVLDNIDYICRNILDDKFHSFSYCSDIDDTIMFVINGYIFNYENFKKIHLSMDFTIFNKEEVKEELSQCEIFKNPRLVNKNIYIKMNKDLKKLIKQLQQEKR